MNMNNSYSEKLKEVIDESDKLSDLERRLWGVFLKHSTELENEAVFEAVNEGEESLLLLSRNLYDKVMSMQN